METNTDLRSAADNLNIQRVPDVDTKCLDNSFLRTEAGGQVLVRPVLRVAVLPLCAREKCRAEPCIVVQALSEPLRLEQIDSDMRR